MASARLSRVTRLGMGLFAVVIPGSALALGSLLPGVLVTVSVLAALACGLLWLEPSGRISKPLLWVVGVALLFVGLTALQCIPLPAALVRVVAPANADIWDHALTAIREPGPSWYPISVAPSATRIELLRGLFYACVFMSATRIVGLDGGTDFLERIVVASACLIALSALAHPAVGAQRLFGIYRPRDSYAYFTGRYSPLLNANHLAAYLDIGACVAMASTVAHRRTMPQALAGAATLLLAGTSVWAGSRGGTGALVVGMLLTLGLSLYLRKRFESSLVGAVLIGVVLVAAAVMVGLGMSEFAREDLSNRDLGKLALGRDALRLVPSAPLFGFGRGAFETVFPSVHHGIEYVTFTHPENLVAQWTVEWGLPAAFAGAAALAWALQPKTLLSAVRPAVGAWAAIAATTLHDLVDFHLEVPGVAAVVAVCAALVVGARGVGAKSDGSVARPALLLRSVAWAAAIGVLGVVVWLLPELSHPLAEDRVVLGKMAVETGGAPARFREAVRAAMLRYPAEPYFPLSGAIRAQVSGEESPIPWVARALERYPGFGRAHIVLARSLAPRHRAQARLEYRLAFENDLALREPALVEGARLVDDLDSGLELLPPGSDAESVLDKLAELLGERLPATALQLDRELLVRSPKAVGPLRRQVRAALGDVTNDAPWCPDRGVCAREALASARELVKREPERCEPRVLLATLEVAGGDPVGAYDHLDRALETTAERGPCQRALVKLAIDTGQRRRVDEALDRIMRGGCGAPPECFDLYWWAASTEEGRTHYVKAIAFYRRALQVAPDRDDFLVRIGELGAHVGLNSEAMDAYGTLAQRHPEDARWPARIAELRAHVDTIPRVFPP